MTYHQPQQQYPSEKTTTNPEFPINYPELQTWILKLLDQPIKRLQRLKETHVGECPKAIASNHTNQNPIERLNPINNYYVFTKQ